MQEPNRHGEASTTMFALAREGDWDGLVSLLQQDDKKSSFRSLLWQAREGQPITNSTLLHVVCHNATVTPIVIETILDIAGPDIASECNWMGQTALHLACLLGGARSCIVRPLVSAKPETTRIKDNEHIRPIDMVCEILIVKEELARYSKAAEEIAQDLWQSCRALVQAFLWEEQRGGRQQPMVHSCLQIGNDCPRALWERVLVRFRDDLQTKDDEFGNLPLHIAAATAPPPREEEETDHLYEILGLYPQAAMVRNNSRQLPLDLAIASGRDWNRGIADLLGAYPAALESKDIDTKYYPLILAQIATRSNVLYGVLLAKPDLFAQASSSWGNNNSNG